LFLVIQMQGKLWHLQTKRGSFFDRPCLKTANRKLLITFQVRRAESQRRENKI